MSNAPVVEAFAWEEVNSSSCEGNESSLIAVVQLAFVFHVEHWHLCTWGSCMYVSLTSSLLKLDFSCYFNGHWCQEWFLTLILYPSSQFHMPSCSFQFEAWLLPWIFDTRLFIPGFSETLFSSVAMIAMFLHLKKGDNRLDNVLNPSFFGATPFLLQACKLS